MILLLVITAVSGGFLKPPRSDNFSRLFQQFADYDLVLHFDKTINCNLVTNLEQAIYSNNINHRPTFIRPEGYKFIHIVFLQNILLFQNFSQVPYNLERNDVVVFLSVQLHDFQVWQVKGLDRACAVFVYDYTQEKIFRYCYYCNNRRAKEADPKKLKMYLHDYSNFKGHIFRIGYIRYPPFFWRDPAGRPKGAEGQLLAEFSKLHNFRFQLIEYKATVNRTVSQLIIRAVENSEIDWAVGGLSVSLTRGISTDFTRGIKPQGFAILYYVYQDSWTLFHRILFVFEWITWICVSTTIFIICCFAKISNLVLGFGSSWLQFARIAVLSIAEQPSPHLRSLKMHTLRLIFLVWWLCSLSLTSVYKSQLASSLIKPKYHEPHTIDDLVKNDFEYFVSNVDWSVLKENLETSSDAIYARVLNRTNDSLGLCQSVLQLNKGKFAVINEEDKLEYDSCSLGASYRSNLRLVTENIFPYSYHGWSMPMGTPFTAKFSKTIGRMHDSGLIDHWYSSVPFYKLPRSNCRCVMRDPEALTLQQIFPCVFILLVGLSVATLVFLAEAYCFYML